MGTDEACDKVVPAEGAGTASMHPDRAARRTSVFARPPIPQQIIHDGPDTALPRRIRSHAFVHHS